MKSSAEYFEWLSDNYTDLEVVGTCGYITLHSCIKCGAVVTDDEIMLERHVAWHTSNLPDAAKFAVCAMRFDDAIR